MICKPFGLIKIASIIEGGGPLAVEGEKKQFVLVKPFNAFSLRLLRSQLPPGGRHVLLRKRSDIRARWLRVILPSAVILFANANSDMCPQAHESDAKYY